MDVDLLVQSKIGKAVRLLRKDTSLLGECARKLSVRWKNLVLSKYKKSSDPPASESSNPTEISNPSPDFSSDIGLQSSSNIDLQISREFEAEMQDNPSSFLFCKPYTHTFHL